MARKRKKREADEGTFADGRAEAPAAEDAGRLTPVDVQQRVFRLAFRGYSERDVDEFLDEVTETLAALHEENKRLREQLQDPGGGAALAGARQQAEAIVRQAREHAARLAAEAGQGPGETGQGPGDAAPAPSGYLVRERAFLQRLASLVQEHARGLTEEAKRARETPAASADSAPPGAEPMVVPGAALAQGEAPPEETEAAPAGGPAAAVIDPDAVEESPPAPSEEAAEGSVAAEPTAPPAPGVEPEDATAPWQPVSPEDQAGPEGGSWPASPSGDDPLVSAWESAFASRAEGEEGSDEPSAEAVAGPGRKREREDEPSLRELFWGEE